MTEHEQYYIGLSTFFAGYILADLVSDLLKMQGKRNFYKIVYGMKKPGIWKRFTATYFLHTRDYSWKESWTRMKYPPNYI